MAYWTKQPQVKCIIAIRDDKLASLDLLKKLYAVDIEEPL